MRILVIGGGGREHALVSTLRRSPRAPQVYCAPGNAGIAREATIVDIRPEGDGIPALAAFAREQGIDLTVVGPEAPLVEGVVDTFQAAGRAIFGPDRKGARLEGSKCFTKEFLARHEIPTARFRIFDTAPSAREYVEGVPLPVVLKADGLAAGKGVFVARERRAALEAVEAILVERRFNKAGDRLVVEECLGGSEVSLLVLTDGDRYVPLETAQDYKPAFDGDRGPNTGGMGCYSPYHAVDGPVVREVLARIVEPTLAGLRAEGIRYSGVLYVGLMLTAAGPQVLEFNCRFGDPETQGILVRLQSDLASVLEECAAGRLARGSLEWDPRHAVCVVAVSGGYPGSYRSGLPIDGLGAVEDPDVKIFHAGTRRGASGEVLTAGGRVLGVTALGKDRRAAREKAYRALARIRFEGMAHRSDIGLEGR
jgi:phosphoribosylamine--glycine ligase